MIEIRTLGSVPFEEIVSCFLEAFDDYFVKMPNDIEYYRTRWEAAGARYDFSFGAFKGPRMVGFVIHGLDRRDGHLVAFNTGTGVIPEYRGQGIASLIYKDAIPFLKERGVIRSRLEVIPQNVPAIKVYEKNGFKITRQYQCFQGPLNKRSSPLTLQPINVSEIPWSILPNQQLQSWDHQMNSLLNGPYEFYQGNLDGQIVGFLGFNVSFKYLALIEVVSGKPAHYDNLLSALSHLVEAVKINNVEIGLQDKIRALKMAGLKNTIDQYEMELELR